MELSTKTQKLRRLDEKVLQGKFYLLMAEYCEIMCRWRGPFNPVEETKQYWVSGEALNWFESYITDRKQFVRIDSSVSEVLPITHRVSPGAILSPLLFCIYINDLSRVPQASELESFVDDSKIFMSFPIEDIASAKTKIEEDLKLVATWFFENKLLINPEKTQLLLIGTRQLLGDFNLPALDWTTFDEQIPTTAGGQPENSFCDLFDDNFLRQFILGPTHNCGNKLDLLLSNCPEIITNVEKSTPEQCKFPTDHYIVEFQIKLKFKRARNVKRRIYNYKMANFEGLRSCLSNVPFENAFSDDIVQHWSDWKDLFLTAVNKFVPVKTIKDINSPQWIDGEVRQLVR
ncbi:Hypothetical predicted protein [Paramuricea clavata]|uniref:Reverse transcriptase domain-containing protein n=1 Tax=Paramuricea clavata TaxID=317549 RepID=A0A7D9F252_PARCT|nr:Hypothetical predicted protein [Paramuricea clavata]